MENTTMTRHDAAEFTREREVYHSPFETLGHWGAVCAMALSAAASIAIIASIIQLAIGA